MEAAVLETARGGILREGLGFDVCDVGIVTNIGEGDHLGLNEVGTVERLAWVKRTVIDSVATWGLESSKLMIRSWLNGASLPRFGDLLRPKP